MLWYQLFIQCLNTSNANYIVEHLSEYNTHHPSTSQGYPKMTFLAEQLWHIHIHMGSTEQCC